MINVVVLCLILCLMYCMISKGRVLEVLESIFWKLGFVDLPEAAEGWRAHIMGGLPPDPQPPKPPLFSSQTGELSSGLGPGERGRAGPD